MDRFQWHSSQSEQLIEWNEDSLRKVGMDFLRLVLINMQDEGSSVKFDKQHNNYRPNYQIKFANGLHQLFNCVSHEPLQTLARSDLSHFSDTFDFSKIRAAYDHLYAEFKH